MIALAILIVVPLLATYQVMGQAWSATSGSNSASVTSGITSEEPVARIAAEASPSVVQVNVQSVDPTPYGTQSTEGIGSGVIYSSDGYIITNAHVVEGASEVDVAFQDGSTEQGEVVGTDSFTDVAVIKVDRSGLPAASFADDSEIVVGQLAVAIGSPSGFQSTVTSGTVSGLGREVSAEYTGGSQSSSLVDLIQTDAAISPGSSGGALLNRDGDVVGMNVAYLPSETGAESIGFAIPSSTVTSVADQLIDTGQAEHPYLGVALTDLTSEIAERYGVGTDSGALVTRVESGGPASNAGLQARDVIIALGDTKTDNSGDLLAALRDYAPGEVVRLTILRDDDERQVEVTLRSRAI